MAGCPYVGLVPFEEKHAKYFFRRDEERRIIADNLRASRLTLLHGASGVGKTSVLQAGVANARVPGPAPPPLPTSAPESASGLCAHSATVRSAAKPSACCEEYREILGPSSVLLVPLGAQDRR